MNQEVKANSRVFKYNYDWYQTTPSVPNGWEVQATRFWAHYKLHMKHDIIFLMTIINDSSSTHIYL